MEESLNVIFHIPMSPDTWKRLQARNVDSDERSSITDELLLRKFIYMM